MSVVGFDFGSQKSVVAVTRRGVIDTIANEVSNRLTPSMVSFGSKERYIGESGLNQLVMNVTNTIGNIQQFLGRKYNEPEIQAELKNIPVRSKELPGGDVGFEFSYNGEQVTFSAVQLCGMILHKLKTTTEKELQNKMTDFVLSVPGYFTDSQRRALLHASSIAGLNCLQLLSDTTATALYWGFYKSLSETESTKALFIDCGYSATRASVVDITKTKLKVLSYAFDRTLGGRNIDNALADHFNAEFKTKYNIEAYSNSRAKVRLVQGCEKLKKVLCSGVNESVLNIENIMADKDVSSRMTRADFEAIIQPLVDRTVEVVKRALAGANLEPSQLAAIEIVGGNKRVPLIQKALGDFLGRELGQTLNDSESVSKGCALQCGMLSPVLRVRQIAITDISLYPIKLSWSGVDEMAVEGQEAAPSAELFTANNAVPATKYITLTRNQPVELNANYLDSPYLPEGHKRAIGRFVIPKIPPPSPEAKENMKVKVKVRLNHHGIFAVESAELQETIEVEEPTPAPSTPEVKPPASPAPETKENNEPAPAEDNATPAASEAKQPASPAPETSEPAKKRKIRNVALTVESEVPTLSQKEVNAYFEEEGKMQSQDKLAAETADAKNGVESYVLDMRSKLCDSLSDYATNAEKDAINAAITAAEDWLYDEGEDTTKGNYVEKKKQLTTLADPIVARKTEHGKRDASFAALKNTIQHYRSTISDVKYDHIEQAEKQKILNECDAVEKSVTELMTKQSQTPKVATPVIRADEIVTKKEAIEKLANPILSKPKPAPPAPAPAPAPAPQPEKPAEEAKPAEETKPEAEPVPMDTEEKKGDEVPMAI